MGRKIGLTLALAVTTLSACNAPTNEPANTQMASGASAKLGDAKHSGYVSAFNMLAQNEFLASKARNYAMHEVPRATPADTLDPTFVTEPVEKIVADLKEARAAPGDASTEPLDAAVDALLPPLQEMVRIERELQPYYASRAYRQDGLAKGKAADGPLKAAYAKALAAFDRMGNALTVYQRARNTQQIADLKTAGHEAEASMLTALSAAETMMAAYAMNDIDAAAKQLPAVSAATDQMRANQGKITKSAGNEHVYKQVLDRLTEMQGLFSDYRNGDNTARDQVLAKYNLAVSMSNQYRFPT